MTCYCLVTKTAVYTLIVSLLSKQPCLVKLDNLSHQCLQQYAQHASD